MKNKQLKLVICWHMHQPHYRDGLDGLYRLPWVYLHGIKDYTDMAAHLENTPKAKVVVNFTPVLLEQIEDYAQQMRAWLNSGQEMCDPLLNWVSGATAITPDYAQRLEIVQACQKAFAPTMIDPYPAFKSLVKMAQCDNEIPFKDFKALVYFNDQYFIDLLMWYHLAWMGASLRLTDQRVAALIQKGSLGAHFSAKDQRTVMEVMADALEGLIPRYRTLMETGQIEISMSPYSHPMIPLLIDFKAMKDAMPYAPMPSSPYYPGGKKRAQWQLEKVFEVFQHYFGTLPKGVWLSEGGVSREAVALLDQYGIQWTASGEGVWRHSCEASHLDNHDISSKRTLYQPFQHAEQKCALFFRDDGLSDLIGFQYKTWNAEDAVNNFISHLHNIADFLGEQVEQHVVSVILDGENAWEYYPENGYHFLSTLYAKLAKDPRIKMTTFAEALAEQVPLRSLPVLSAGSWVYGSFSTWIGEPHKNAGWDLLVEAKQTYDQVVASGKLTAEQKTAATGQLAICESSDWFWWLGDYNPASSVQDFEALYRRHLQKLYQLLEAPVPDSLNTPLSKGGGDMENGGVMQRGVSE